MTDQTFLINLMIAKKSYPNHVRFRLDSPFNRLYLFHTLTLLCILFCTCIDYIKQDYLLTITVVPCPKGGHRPRPRPWLLARDPSYSQFIG